MKHPFKAYPHHTRDTSPSQLLLPLRTFELLRHCRNAAYSLAWPYQGSRQTPSVKLSWRGKHSMGAHFPIHTARPLSNAAPSYTGHTITAPHTTRSCYLGVHHDSFSDSPLSTISPSSSMKLLTGALDPKRHGVYLTLVLRIPPLDIPAFALPSPLHMPLCRKYLPMSLYSFSTAASFHHGKLLSSPFHSEAIATLSNIMRSWIASPAGNNVAA